MKNKIRIKEILQIFNKDAPELYKKYQYLENNFKQPIITKENISNNAIIEVGDIVYFCRPEEKYLIVADNGKTTRIRWLFGKIGNEMDYPYSLKEINSFSEWKLLTKKASQTTTTYEKQVEEQPKNVLQTTLLRFEPEDELLIDTSVKKIKSIKQELIELN